MYYADLNQCLFQVECELQETTSQSSSVEKASVFEWAFSYSRGEYKKRQDQILRRDLTNLRLVRS